MTSQDSLGELWFDSRMLTPLIKGKVSTKIIADWAQNRMMQGIMRELIGVELKQPSNNKILEGSLGFSRSSWEKLGEEAGSSSAQDIEALDHRGMENVELRQRGRLLKYVNRLAKGLDTGKDNRVWRCQVASCMVGTVVESMQLKGLSSCFTEDYNRSRDFVRPWSTLHTDDEPDEVSPEELKRRIALEELKKQRHTRKAQVIAPPPKAGLNLPYKPPTFADPQTQSSTTATDLGQVQGAKRSTSAPPSPKKKRARRTDDPKNRANLLKPAAQRTDTPADYGIADSKKDIDYLLAESDGEGSDAAHNAPAATSAAVAPISPAFSDIASSIACLDTAGLKNMIKQAGKTANCFKNHATNSAKGPLQCAYYRIQEKVQQELVKIAENQLQMLKNASTSGNTTKAARDSLFVRPGKEEEADERDPVPPYQEERA